MVSLSLSAILWVHDAMKFPGSINELAISYTVPHVMDFFTLFQSSGVMFIDKKSWSLLKDGKSQYTGIYGFGNVQLKSPGLSCRVQGNLRPEGRNANERMRRMSFPRSHCNYYPVWRSKQHFFVLDECVWLETEDSPLIRTARSSCNPWEKWGREPALLVDTSVYSVCICVCEKVFIRTQAEAAGRWMCPQSRRVWGSAVIRL